MIDELILRYQTLLTEWVEFDDNRKFFGIGVGNWLAYIDKKTAEQVTTQVM